jgi:hypothetical protein
MQLVCTSPIHPPTLEGPDDPEAVRNLPVRDLKRRVMHTDQSRVPEESI